MNKLEIKSVLFFVAVFFFTMNAWACDCIWGGSFLKSLGNSDIVFTGRIIGYDQYSLVKIGDTSSYSPSIMIIEIEELIKMKEGVFSVLDHMKPKRMIRVLGNVESNCRPEVKDFPLESKWLFKMNKAIEDNYFKIDLTVSNCATNYLKIEGGKVYGNIEGTNQITVQDTVEKKMGLDELIGRLQEN